jgi:flagellar assembly protein FliH
MAKYEGTIRGGRIPAAEAGDATAWQLPTVTSDKVFKLASGGAQKRMPAAAFGPTAKPAAGDAAVSPRDRRQQVISADAIARARQPRPAKALGADPVTQDLDDQPPSNSLTADAHSVSVTPPAQPEASPSVDHEPAATASLGYLAGIEQGKKDGFSEGQQAGLEAGQQAGKVDGEAAARAEFEEEISSQREVIKALLTGFDAPLAELRKQMEQMLVPLVTQISEAVILGELKQHPEQVRGIVSAGLQAMPHGSSGLQISVNPQVVEFVRDRLALEDQPVELLEDAKLAVGSCRIHSAQTNIDNSLSRNLRRCLSQAFKEEPGAEAVIDEISESDLQRASETLFDA